MSLRDQLVAKGLVSKKRARKAERELKQSRKSEQGSRKRKAEVAAQQHATERAEAEEAAERRRLDARARQARRGAVEKRLRVRNLILGNRLPSGRGHRFFHRHPEGAAVCELQVSSGIAMALRNGDAALARQEHSDWWEAVVVRRSAAEKLKELAPEVLLFFVEDPCGVSAPELAFHTRDWPVELGPHRATEADLDRFR